MAQTKATKKFEKRHLKDTLDRRNSLKKIKQKQQLKAKKKARRAEENGGPDGAAAEEQVKAKRSRNGDENAFKDMSVDDFFQGGFEIPEQPKTKGSKRKRREEEGEGRDEAADGSVSAVDTHSVDSDIESDSEMDFEEHKRQLDALAETDPEFHKYLQENDPELLNGDSNLPDTLDDEAEPTRKKQKTDMSDDESDGNAVDGAHGKELTRDMVQRWHTALKEQHSLRATREVVLAFRSAVHVSEEDGKQYKYVISDSEVYHDLLTVALKLVPVVFQHHIPVQENKNGRVHVATDGKKFKTLGPILKSHMASVLHLLDHLSDPATLRLTMSSILPLLPYLLSFKKVVRDLAKVVTNAWATSSNSEAARVAAFLVLRRLVVIGDPGIRENILKAAYQGLIQGSRQTTVHTISGVNLMKNSAAELWGIDISVGYTTAFNYIRQLAIHLRSSIQNKSKESYKQVYNWQYTHSLDFWSRVLSAHCTSSDSPLQPLIYPLVQVTLGALRLIPTATYFPLRFQLIRSLLRISRATNNYIPIAPALYEVLNSSEMRKPPKPSTLKPLDFATSIRASKSYLKTRTYQDSIGEQVQELFSEFFVLWSKNIAFPELALPVIVMLKRWLKDVGQRGASKGNKNAKVNNGIVLLVQKIEANARFIEERRAKVDFAPKDRSAVEAFLRDLNWERTPMGAFVVGQRAVREERARVLQEARDEENRRDRQRRDAKRAARDEADALSSEDDGSDVSEDAGDVDDSEDNADSE